MKHFTIDDSTTAFRCSPPLGASTTCQSCGRLRLSPRAALSSTGVTVSASCRGCGESFADHVDDSTAAVKIVIANYLI